MNLQEQLASHYRMYSYLEEQSIKTKREDEMNDWQLLLIRYPEYLNLIDDLISSLESGVKREQELLADIENLKKKIPPPSDREGLQSYLGWDENKEIDDDDENCWVEYHTVEE